MAGDGLIVIDPTEWHRLSGALKTFDPSLDRALKRRMRAGGVIARDAVKAKLSEDGVGPSRRALIDATNVRVSFAKNAAGVSIRTSSSKLPAEHKGFLNVYNKSSFRHPLFGDKAHYFTQKGHPYFETGIKEVLDDKVFGEFRAALDDAVHAIGGRGK